MTTRACALSILQQAPHWAHIAVRAESWADAVASLHGDDALHQAAIDATFLSGSDLSVLTKHLNGLGDPWSSAREVCAYKLLLQVPRLLPRVRPSLSRRALAFLATRGIRIDRSAEQAARASNVDGLRFGEGHMVTLPNGRRSLIVEARAIQGSVDIYADAVRLHADLILVRRAGLQVDGLLLLQPANLGAVADAFRIEQIDERQQLSREIEQANRLYWRHFVGSDVLPQAEPFTDEEREQAFQQSLLGVADRAALLRLIGDAAYAEFKQLEPRLRDEVAEVNPADGSLYLRALVIEQQEGNALRFLLARSPQLSALRAQLRTDVRRTLESHLTSLKSISDLDEFKLIPATEVTNKPARSRLVPKS